ncbi:MAG: YebC/PmpR family DNA-binding transcriptional regulator [candidate division WOR-3 bacterium]|nr:YebC/PmpR family DNA-binding transcriptional regulator [candidate division WOR-3 bacterium]MCX7947099.1 YebC/PmpR family DNA-binding transcriptional regulator [candidate division WOR-3 bacterium]MDW8149860.1 YebC/PmpR family DNA-binding transcriptional regulator [candidate division WOR-3 bacterium]
MAGHSKWAQIKHKKAIKDARKGKLFSKIVREITVAVKVGGPDPEGNPRLRLALEKAKEVNLPKDNIERAIKKAIGGDEGNNYEEVIYEGYGPEGVAFVVKTLTDNKNRTVNEIRYIFSKYGGSLATSGSVLWQFSEKGTIYILKNKVREEEVFELALSLNIEDIKEDEDSYVVYTLPKDFHSVKEKLQESGIEIESATITLIPQNTIKVSSDKAQKVLKLYEALEEHDDVQEVYANFDIEKEVLEAFTSE